MNEYVATLKLENRNAIYCNKKTATLIAMLLVYSDNIRGRILSTYQNSLLHKHQNNLPAVDLLLF